MNREPNQQDEKKSQKRSVLIIDDDQYLLGMYALKFKNADFDAVIVSGGKDAMQKLKDGFKPDVILLDFIMPDMNGLDFLEEAKKNGLLSDTKVVALTNQSQQEDIERAKSLGVMKYIVKASTIPSEVVSEVKKITE